MKYQNLKKDSEAFLNGIKIEIDRVDNNPRAVTLTDDVGNILKIQITSYNFEVLVPAAPKMKEVYSVRGNICGVVVNEQFDDKSLAGNRKDELESNTRGSCELQIVKESVPEIE